MGIRDFTTDRIAEKMMKRRINVHVMMDYWWRCGKILATIRNENSDRYMKVDQEVSL
jgi:head-tail adaptor